jgi:hypothetical protein
MILIDILRKIFGKKTRVVKPTPPVIYTPPEDEIDPLTGKKKKKTVIVIEDPYEKDTMKLFDKLFNDFLSNNIQLSELKRKYTEKVLSNLGEYSYLAEMLRNLLYYKKVDIIDVDKNYLETEKNKSKFSSVKNAIVNFSVEDKIKFEDEISKTGLPILGIVDNIKKLYNTIDEKKYFNFKVKIKDLYDKQLKYYRDTYGYLKDPKFDLKAPVFILDKPTEEKATPTTGAEQTQTGANVNVVNQPTTLQNNPVNAPQTTSGSSEFQKLANAQSEYRA